MSAASVREEQITREVHITGYEQTHPVCALQGAPPRLHGTPLQQSAAVLHDWPKREHIPLDPPSWPGGGGGTAPQVPCVLPCGTVQCSVAQQSASVVQAPVDGLHIAPHTSWPF
jgi:hypothetical protein